MEKSGIRIEDLRSLQSRYPDWEQKLYFLWMALENDVPTDLVEPTQTIDNWRRTLIAPWFNPHHVYLALDGNEWIGLSSYDRGIQSRTRFQLILQVCSRNIDAAAFAQRLKCMH